MALLAASGSPQSEADEEAKRLYLSRMGGNVRNMPPSPAGPGMPTTYDPNAAYLGYSPDYYKEEGRRYAGLARAADERAAPQADYAASMRARGEQGAALGLLRGAAYGQAPSAATGYMQSGLNRAEAGAAPALYATGPLGQAMALRGGGAQMAGGGLAATGGAGQMRAGEMEAARAGYFGGALGMGGQDIRQAQYQADMAQRARALNDARALEFLGMEQRTYGGQRAALMEQQRLLAQQYAAAQELEAEQRRRRAAADAAALNTGLAAGAGVASGVLSISDSSAKHAARIEGIAEGLRVGRVLVPTYPRSAALTEMSRPEGARAVPVESPLRPEHFPEVPAEHFLRRQPESRGETDAEAREAARLEILRTQWRPPTPAMSEQGQNPSVSPQNAAVASSPVPALSAERLQQIERLQRIARLVPTPVPALPWQTAYGGAQAVPSPVPFAPSAGIQSAMAAKMPYGTLGIPTPQQPSIPTPQRPGLAGFRPPPEHQMMASNRAMQAYPYAYRPGLAPPEQAPGEANVGPMADQMAQNPIAATAVRQDAQTGMLGLDRDKALKLTMGGVASLQGQMDRMRLGAGY